MTDNKKRTSGDVRANSWGERHSKLTDKSTATEAQERRIIEALRERPQTTDDLRALGIFQVSARVFGLRAKGYSIHTILFDGLAADGFRHTRMARYALMSEPNGGIMSNSEVVYLHDRLYALEGEKRDMTLLLADLRRMTGAQDAPELLAIVRELLKVARDVGAA
jgi:hypothetical protein